jgi:diguanylate cyclase (GGDEF)-like protein
MTRVRRSWWSAGVALHGVLLLGYLALAVSGGWSAETRSTISCLLMLEAALFAGRSAARTAVATGPGRTRLPWRLLAAGCFGWAVAQVWWTYLELFDSEPPFLLTATGVGYAALPLLALPALRLLVVAQPVRRPSPYGWAPRLLDVIALSGGVVVLGWQLTLQAATLQDRPFPIVYSVGDVVIAIAVLALLVRHAGAVLRPLQLAAAGLLLVAATDLTYVGLALDGSYVTGTWLDTGWLGGFLLIAAGARSALGAPAQRPVSRAGRRLQLLLPNLPVALAVGVAGYGVVQGRSGPVVLSLALMIVLVASLRQALTLSQNADLLDELALREVDLRRRALEDPLTGLGNRTLLVERLDAALLDRAAGPLSLLYLDLDDFKLINDTHGHEAGDHVLVEVGRRLAALVGPLDAVARLGGDEFAVLLRGRDAEDFARTLLQALQQPVHVGARRFVVNGSIGLVRAEAAAETAGTLLSHADIAMYTAKGAGKGRFAAVHGRGRADAVRKTRMRELVAHPRLEDFSVLYQPVVDLQDGQVRGVEALVRWTDPEIGPVSPVDFIHLAEQAGSIGVIGRHVLQTALRDLAGWDRQFPHLRMAVGVNVSPLQLCDGTLLSVARQALADGGLRQDQLVLEITEEALVGDIEQAAQAVRSLRQAGISVAIDDFGTGYSSFRYLDRFDADVLKIDRSFVAKMSTNDRTRELVRSVSDLGRVLDLQTIAEGVETLADLQVLRQLGVQLAQGFLFSRPVEAQRITNLLAGGGRFSLDAAMPAPRPADPVLHIA